MRTARVLLLIVLGAAACDTRTDRVLNVGPSVVVPPGTSTAVPTPSISSITPAFAIAGSSDLVLKVTGTNFIQAFPNTSIAIWSANGEAPNHGVPGITELATTFVSQTELSAVIPAALLSRPGTAGLTVMNGDSMGFSDGYVGYPRSSSVSFSVMPAVYLATFEASPSCASALPSTARERTYTARLLPDGSLEWTGPTLNPPSAHGHETISSATISENTFSFFVDTDRDPQSDDFHGLWEDMGGGTILNISGKGGGRLHDGEITGTLDGLFAFYEPNPWAGHYCKATDHRFRFVTQ